MHSSSTPIATSESIAAATWAAGATPAVEEFALKVRAG